MGSWDRKVPRDLLLDPPPRKRRLWFWLLMVLGGVVAGLYVRDAMATPMPEVATGELLFLANGQYQQALHLDTLVDVTVTGIVARTTMRQRFHNGSDQWQEAVYLFPLPEDAGVDHMQIVIGDRVITSVVQEKAKARRTYEQARAEGRSAALTEQQRPNLFIQSVANIPPNETITVEIRFIHLAAFVHGEFSLRLPLTLTPRYSPGQPADLTRDSVAPGTVSIQVELNTGLRLSQVVSSSHDIEVRGSGARAFVSLPAKKTAPDRDFVLKWRTLVGATPQAAVFTERVGNHDFALVMVQPPQVEAGVNPMPRDMIFIIDVSGSMEGPSIEQARLGLQSAVDSLRPEDRFNIIAFASDFSMLFPGSVRPDSFNVAKAERWIRGLTAGGGTEMAAPLAAALGSSDVSGYLKQILFITDGAVGNESALFKLVQMHLGDARLFTVGIGSAPNSYFMRKAAQFGRGTFTHIGSTNEVATQMRALLERIASPVASNIQLYWHGSANVESFPDKIPALYMSEPLVIVARSETLQGSLEVTGETNNLTWSRALELRVGGEASGLASLWARAKIDSLEDEKVMGRDGDSVRKEVIDLAMTHHLVSPYTSLVAVESYVSRPPSESLASATTLAAVALPATGTASVLAFVLGCLFLFGGTALWILRRCV